MKGDAIMKRKIMAILLAAAMTGSLAGCGSTQDKNAADASEQKNESSNGKQTLVISPTRASIR